MRVHVCYTCILNMCMSLRVCVSEHIFDSLCVYVYVCVCLPVHNLTCVHVFQPVHVCMSTSVTTFEVCAQTCTCDFVSVHVYFC